MTKVTKINKGNYKNLPEHGETNNLPSMTEPDQALSMKEIYNRYANGNVGTIPPSAFNFTEEFSGFDQIPDLEKMDKVELIEYGRQLEEWKQNGIKELEQIKKQKDKALKLQKEMEKQEEQKKTKAENPQGSQS